MPALLIVNPHATATNQLRRDVITHALASQMDLEVVETRYRGHAGTLARQAASDGLQLIVRQFGRIDRHSAFGAAIWQLG